MHRKVVSVGVIVLSFVAQVAVAVEPDTDEDKTLYALGFALSRNLAPFHLSRGELEFVEEGLRDGILDKPYKVDMGEFGPKLKPFAESRGAGAIVK